MNHWAFVLAAYLVAGGSVAALIAASFLGMRRAEARAERVERTP